MSRRRPAQFDREEMFDGVTEYWQGGPPDEEPPEMQLGDPLDQMGGDIPGYEDLTEPNP